MKTVPSVYTLLMVTIYLSHSTQVAEGIVFRKYTVCYSFYSCKIWNEKMELFSNYKIKEGKFLKTENSLNKKDRSYTLPAGYRKWKS